MIRRFGRRQRGFSLIEILVVLGMLMLILAGLFALASQVQFQRAITTEVRRTSAIYATLLNMTTSVGKGSSSFLGTQAISGNDWGFGTPTTLAGAGGTGEGCTGYCNQLGGSTWVGWHSCDRTGNSRVHNNGVKVGFDNLDKRACISLVSSMQPSNQVQLLVTNPLSQRFLDDCERDEAAGFIGRCQRAPRNSPGFCGDELKTISLAVASKYCKETGNSLRFIWYAAPGRKGAL